MGPGSIAEQLRIAQDLSNTGTWTLDMASNSMIWSDQIFDILGLPQARTKPSLQEYTALIHPDDAALFDRYLRKTVESPSLPSLEYKIIRPDGRTRTLTTLATVERNSADIGVRLVGAVQDITDFCDAKDTAHGARKMLINMLEISPEAIILTDVASRILSFSAGAQAVFGYTEKEICGQTVEALMPDRFRARHHHHVNAFSFGVRPSLKMHERSEIIGRRKMATNFPPKPRSQSSKRPMA